MRAIVLALLLASGCAADFGTVVNVGPSAERHIEEIADAVDEMNGLLGYKVFSVRMVDSDEMIDDQVIVRHRDAPFRRESAAAFTRLTSFGLVISMRDTCNERCFLHELGHAGGLMHSSDPKNTMFHEVGAAYLTERQINRVLLLDRYRSEKIEEDTHER